MTKEEIKEVEQLFPKKCLITPEIISSGKSIGTQLLKSFIPKQFHEEIFWGLSIGNINQIRIKTETEIVYDGKKVRIPLYLDSSIKEPCEIEFTLRK
jgi:hypothetical protein